jgi:nickel-dependent lactate racemase
VQLQIGAENLVAGQRAPIALDLADPVQALRDALEHPLDYPALRLALTPDDHIAVVVDEGIPHLGRLLTALLEHVAQAHVRPEMITLICTGPSGQQSWLDDLSEEFQDVQVEVHQPADRKKLAYLATTKAGRRIYLNRTAVDADQAIIFTRRGYDPQLGYSGAETALYPGLADEATANELLARLKSKPPGTQPGPIQQGAREVAWMSGAPFFVQVIPGSGDAVSGILAGPLESSDAGQSQLDARWRIEFAHAADVVIAGVSGEAMMAQLASAFFMAARVVKPGGSIAVLSEGTPKPGPSFEVFRRHDDAGLALPVLMQERQADLAAGFMWATAATQARLYLLSGLPDDVAEELFTIPLQKAEQAQRLATAGASCIVLEDADRALAVLGHAK